MAGRTVLFVLWAILAFGITIDAVMFQITVEKTRATRQLTLLLSSEVAEMVLTFEARCVICAVQTVLLACSALLGALIVPLSILAHFRLPRTPQSVLNPDISFFACIAYVKKLAFFAVRHARLAMASRRVIPVRIWTSSLTFRLNYVVTFFAWLADVFVKALDAVVDAFFTFVYIGIVKFACDTATVALRVTDPVVWNAF